MVRFNVGGQFLDLPSDLKLSLQKTNILFGFDAVKCERTASFDVPITTINSHIFSFAHLINTRGDGMRRRYDAQMQGSGVTKDGYLYVDECSKGNYRCVFVTGELVGLQRLRDLGKFADFSADVGYSRDYYGTGVSAEGTATGKPFDLVRHYQGASLPPIPSVGVPWLLDRIRQASGVRITPPDIAQYLRIIAPAPATTADIAAMIRVRGLGDRPSREAHDDDPSNTAEVESGEGIVDVESVLLDTHAGDEYNPQYVEYWQYYLQVFVAHQAIDVTFPNDFPANVFLVRWRWPNTLYRVEYEEGKYHEAIEFLGDYSFKKRYRSTGETYDHTTGLTGTAGAYTTEGEPLAGRTVSIESGARFFFVTPADFCAGVDPSSEGQHTYYKNDWSPHQPDLDISLAIEASSDVAEVGDRVRLKDNLPPMTATDLLKMLGAVSGRQLMYSDADGVTYDELDIDRWEVYDLTGKVIELSSMTRTFADYGQRNVVRYADDKLVPGAQRIEAEYRIINANLAEEVELQELPVSSGASKIVGDNEYTYIANGDDAEAEEYVLARHGAEYLRRVYLPTNPGLVSILDASTSVKIKARASLLEYERITPKTLLYYSGVRYVWTGAKWSNGVMTIDASKV